MKKCIALHHCKLQGRRINVERSCGGRNKDLRTKRIREQRFRQKVEVSDIIDGVINPAVEGGLVPRGVQDDAILNRLYALQKGTVKEIIKTFTTQEAEVKGGGNADDAARVIHFKKVLAAVDEDGKAVDQSKQRRMGNPNPTGGR